MLKLLAALVVAVATLPALAMDLDPVLVVQPSVGFPLSKPQSDVFGVGGGVALKGTVRLLQPLHLEVGVGTTGYSAKGDNGAVGITDIGVGPRLQLPIGSGPLSWWLAVDLQYVRTGPLNRFGWAPQAGVQYDLTRLIAVGLFARYQMIVSQVRPGFDPSSANLMAVGFSLSVALFRPEPPPPPAPVVAPPPPKALPVDTDGDGIPDDSDKCPRSKGPIENLGCPYADTDKDGVPDVDDKCPSVPGDPALGGCPDTDKDGVRDIDDQCPAVKGDPRLGGCPDTDKDGIRDVDDKCPLVPGEAALGGCPAYKQVALKDDRIEIKEKIFFFHDSAKIEDRSSSLIGEIAQLLKDQPTLRIRIEGHTDASGKEPHNLALSDARAAAVRQALVDHGVAGDRVEAKGFGSGRPIDSNKTLEGRENNRRVEFLILR